MLDKSELVDAKMSEIHDDEHFNCRGRIAPVDVVDLVHDIETRGLIQPIIIAPYDEAKAASIGKKYRLVAGYRRFTAFKILKREVIPAIIRTDMINEVDARCFNLAENVQRQDLNIMQEALALNELVKLGLNRKQLAARTQTSDGWVQVRLMLLDLPEEIQHEAAAGYLTQPQIREVSSIIRTHGKERGFEAVKQLKDAKILGRKAQINMGKLNPTTKKHRGRTEIFDMIAFMSETLGYGFWSRCLSWAAGEISDEELHASAAEYGKTLGKVYVPPQQGLSVSAVA